MKARALLYLTSLLALFTMLLGQGFFQPAQAEVDPFPEPTDAAAQASETIEVDGWAPQPGRRQADRSRQAAMLDGYRHLIEAGHARAGFGVVLTPAQGQSRRFVIDSKHPNDRLLAWALRAKVVDTSSQEGNLKLRLQSPPVGDLSAPTPALAGSIDRDLDADGFAEKIGVGYDGRVYLFKSGEGGWTIRGHSPSLASYESLARQDKRGSWERIRLTRVDSLIKAEASAPRQARATVRMHSEEVVQGRLIASYTKDWVVTVNLDEVHEPTIRLEEPFDFSSTSERELSLSGEMYAPAGLASSRVSLNGRELWKSPPGYQSSQLRLDMMVNATPGWNRIEVEATDNRRQTTRRELLLRGDGVARPTPEHRWAIVIGEDSTALASALKTGAAIPDGHLQTVSRRTTASVKAELQRWAGQAGPHDLLVLYYRGKARQAGEDKLLELSDGTAGAKQLIEWIGPLQGRKVVAIFDTDQGPSMQAEATFLEQLAEAGWAAIGGSPESLLEAVVSGLGGRADLDGDRTIRLDEFYPYLCQGDQPPLLRGLVTGGVPMATVR